MTRKILIFTMSENQSKYETERMIEEAEKMGIKAERALYRELSFDLVLGDSKVFWRGERLGKKNLLGVWFRVAGTKSGKYVLAKDMLIKLLKKEVFCINGEGYLRWQRMGKILQYMEFVEAGIPVVPTKIFYTVEQVKNSKIGEDFAWPIIAKHEKGFQGKSVRKFENEKEMFRFLGRIDEKNLGMFLWQKYLPTKWDLRVIVLGGKVLGAMKRSASGSEFRSNYSLGGEVEKWDLSEDDGRLAERVANLCRLDYCGVDIMKNEAGESFVLEVNRQCQFKGFEESTRINVAKKTIEMVLNR